MSLRDALLAKGLVTKKQAQQSDREAKKERKASQGARLSKAEERRLQEQEEAARLEELRARAAERRRREEEKDRMERAIRARQMVAARQIRVRGPFRIYHRALDGRTLLRKEVSERAAFNLRNGDFAIAAIPTGKEVQYAVIPRDAAEKLESLAPNLLVFWTRDTEGLSDPSLRLEARAFEPDLRARRARDEDVRRLLAPEPQGLG